MPRVISASQFAGLGSDLGLTSETELSHQGNLACPGVKLGWGKLADSPYLERSSHSGGSMNTALQAECHLQTHTPQEISVRHFNPAYLGKGQAHVCTEHFGSNTD